MSDLIDREEAIDALWQALYEYEDKMEKQFQESEDLDVGDWICHRIFVQNMSDIDKQTILNLPTVDAVPLELIYQEIERLDRLAEYELNELGELGEAFYGSCALSQLLKKWAERKEE